MKTGFRQAGLRRINVDEVDRQNSEIRIKKVLNQLPAGRQDSGLFYCVLESKNRNTD